ncbi:YceI family protein [Marinomonas colpomeniae]|uniref:YceI family protein n=1 Tax=Marinomonas colpomeniae TaxID=2774408 RepID=A0ABR8P0J3_9GAMM|nr:YceI family protein [Marinomonas colpomeniae]MBD5770807.1 YceI family protein [Marinomonas colpomeniae]
MNTLLKSTLFSLAVATSGFATAATYVIDDVRSGAHSQLDVKVSHIGISWVKGRFDDFSGSFEYDKDKIDDSSIEVTIQTSSFDSNHAKRDKHIMSSDILDVSEYPTATFKSTSIKDMGNGKVEVNGDLNLHGVTKTISFDAVLIGEGKSPWGDYRAGFEGSAELKFSDFNIDTKKIGTDNFTINMFFEGKASK